MTTATIASTAPQRRPGFAFPLILITLGVLFLLANLGYLGGLRWSELFRLWPVLFVIAGVDILLRSRSYLLALVIDVAIIAAAVVYLVSGAGVSAAPMSYSVDVPRAGVTDLGVTLNYGAGTVRVTGGATELVSVRSTQEDIVRTVDQTSDRANVTVSSNTDGRFVWNGRDRAWDVTLPSDVRTAITMNLGAGDFNVDLSNVRLVRATLNGGASNFVVRLPRPAGDVPVKISAGAASLDITIPQGVAYRITYTGFMQSISGPTSTPDYATAKDRLTIELSSAMSSVTIH